MKSSASDQPKKTSRIFISYIITAGSWREESVWRVLKQAPAFTTAGCASIATFLISLQIKLHFLQEAGRGNSVSIEEYHTNGNSGRGGEDRKKKKR